MSNVSWIVAFVAGLISFLSPCVLPLVPGYLSFVSGVSAEELRAGADASARRKVVANALAFIFGFSVVFVALGASATSLGQLLNAQMPLLTKVAGVLVVIMGLHTLGVFKIKWLYMEKRVQVAAKPVGLVGSALVGLAFAFGWTPCIGPILSAILAIASTEGTVVRGMLLLTAYSLGLGLPFFLTALAVNQFFTAMGRFRKHMSTVERVSGVLLVAIGLLIFTNKLTLLTSVTRSLPDVGQQLEQRLEHAR